MLNDHNHNVIAENIVGRQIINSFIKNKCENDLLTRPNKIIRAELQNENDIELVPSDVRLLRKSMYDFRRKSIPKIPKSVEESKVQIFDRRENIISNTGEFFCHMETISSPVFLTCATNLEILKVIEVLTYSPMGTFSHSPKHYEQLQTIHILQNELCLELTSINLQLSLSQSTFHFDFEKSKHNAIKEIF
ncbi:hypothetical protein QTP88_023241 [Uroleucon formosanum]